MSKTKDADPLRAAWAPIEDPEGFAVSYLYDNLGHVAALRLDRLDGTHVGDYTDVGELLAQAGSAASEPAVT